MGHFGPGTWSKTLSNSSLQCSRIQEIGSKKITREVQRLVLWNSSGSTRQQQQQTVSSVPGAI